MLGQALGAIRRFHELTLTEAAFRIGVSKSYLSEIENCIAEPTIDTLRKIADAYDMKLSQILFFSENIGDMEYMKGEKPLVKITRRILAQNWLKLLQKLSNPEAT